MKANKLMIRAGVLAGIGYLGFIVYKYIKDKNSTKPKKIETLESCKRKDGYTWVQPICVKAPCNGYCEKTEYLNTK